VYNYTHNRYTLFTLGNFGNGVLSYFIFLKSLLYLNVVIFLLVFGFTVIPQIVVDNGELIADITNQFVTTSSDNFTCPNENKEFYKNRTLANNVLDFFSGQVCSLHITQTLEFGCG